MKAYVIKNKEGKYLHGFDIISYESEFCENIIDAAGFETKEFAECEVFGTGLIDYTIVPITICEGDLEEEVHILDKALKMAVLHLVGIDIAHKLAGIENIPVITDFNYFIKQAKESEKDGEV